jgi:hypothetical protein
MRKFRDLVEAKETIVFAYGRFNPPTTGHEKLIQKVASIAGSNPYRIYPSHSQNPKRDPLPQALKTAYMRKMFKKYAKNIVISKSKNAIEIAVELYDQGYKNLVMVAGSDRVKVFDDMLNQYNGVEGKGHGYYKFDSIKIVSAGERDPDAEGVEGMSASKMRAAAADGDFDSFSQGISSGISDGKKLYRDVRKYMGVREERDMGDMTDFETLRDAYLTGQIWNVGDVVEAKGIVGEVVRKGTNYLSFVAEDGKVHKAWLHEIELDEAFPVQVTVKDKKGKTHTIGTRDLRGATHALLIHYKEIPPVKGGLPGSKETKLPKTEIFLGTEKELAKTAKQMLKQHPAAKYATGAEVVKLDQSMVKGATLTERNYSKEYANYHSRPEQIERRSSRNKARRVMGDRTKIGMDVGHKDNDPMNNDPSNLDNEDPSDNRREPRLREDKLNEDWWNKVIAKLNQMTHPKDYGVMVQDYAELMKQKKYQEHPSKAASEVARKHEGVDIRGFVKYINTLVAKKILPQELKAEYEIGDNMFTFKEFMDEVQEEMKPPKPGVKPPKPDPRLSRKPVGTQTGSTTSGFGPKPGAKPGSTTVPPKAKPKTLPGFEGSPIPPKPRTKPPKPPKPPRGTPTSGFPAVPETHEKTVADHAKDAGISAQELEFRLGRESGGKHYYSDGTVKLGDRSLKDKAHGAGQVRKPALDAVNKDRPIGKDGKRKNQWTVDDIIRDPDKNIEVAARYLAKNKKDTGNPTQDKKDAQAAYRGGPGWKESRAGKKAADEEDKAWDKKFGKNEEFGVNEDQVVSKNVSDRGVKTTKFKSGSTASTGAGGTVHRSATGQQTKHVSPRIGGVRTTTKPSAAAGPGSRGVTKTRDFSGKVRGTNVNLTTGPGGQAKKAVVRKKDVKISATPQRTSVKVGPASVSRRNEEMTFKDFVNQIQKGPIKEVLAKDADMGDYIDDFAKSDAPQFKGKSKEKRKEMAIAAYYAKNGS